MSPHRHPPEVSVAAPEQRDVMGYQEFTGRTEAIESVEVRARVAGVLERQEFQASSRVRKGQLLFVIERAPYLAARDGAAAEVQTWEAELSRAKSDLERLEQAIRTNAVSQQEVDRARADVQQAEANLLGAKASLEKAELDLSYTEVRSPINGIVSRKQVDLGNLVGSGENTLLTTVARFDPIYAYFDVSERILLSFLNDQGQSVTDNRARKGRRRCRVSRPRQRERLAARRLSQLHRQHRGREYRHDSSAGRFPKSRRSVVSRAVRAYPRSDRTSREGALLVSERAIGTDLAASTCSSWAPITSSSSATWSSGSSKTACESYCPGSSRASATLLMVSNGRVRGFP